MTVPRPESRNHLMIHDLRIFSLAYSNHPNRRKSSLDRSKHLLFVCVTYPSVFRHLITIFYDSLHVCWHIPLSSDHSGDRRSAPIADEQRSEPDLSHLDLLNQNYKHLRHLASERFNSTKFSNSWEFHSSFFKNLPVLEICKEFPVPSYSTTEGFTKPQWIPRLDTELKSSDWSSGKVSSFRSLRQQ